MHAEGWSRLVDAGAGRSRGMCGTTELIIAGGGGGGVGGDLCPKGEELFTGLRKPGLRHHRVRLKAGLQLHKPCGL